MADFNKAQSFTAKWEGQISDVPQDRGGITAYGVSRVFLESMEKIQSKRAFLQQIGVILPIKKDSILHLSYEKAKAIFKQEFWNALNLDALPQRPATLMYDMAVNHGCPRAVILAQRGYNKCIGIYGVPLVEDGILGTKTRAALAYDTDAILGKILTERENFYAKIIENDPTQAVFEKGWNNRTRALRGHLELA